MLRELEIACGESAADVRDDDLGPPWLVTEQIYRILSSVTSVSSASATAWKKRPASVARTEPCDGRDCGRACVSLQPLLARDD